MDSKYKSQMKYMAEQCERVYIRLSKNTDGDLLKWLDSKGRGNKQTYIKQLIRADMEREKNILKK